MLLFSPFYMFIKPTSKIKCSCDMHVHVLVCMIPSSSIRVIANGKMTYNGECQKFLSPQAMVTFMIIKMIVI